MKKLLLVAKEISYVTLIVHSAQEIVHRKKNMMNSAPVTGGDYKGLVVYQKAISNTIALFGYYKIQKLLWSERFLVEQLLRASASVGANIVEGYGRGSKREYRRFLLIAKGSSLEAEYWIDLISKIRPQDSKILENIKGINTEVVKILTVLIRNQK
ncbi:MAG: four helix bundle protein [Candidatus Blackburnbacteria bacterium]|nr:four helix bundle protein [Candidatus Blackburnbacteria bacterium]